MSRMHKNYKILYRVYLRCLECIRITIYLRCLECIRITTLDVKSKMSKMHCLHVKPITLVQKVNLYNVIRIYVVNCTSINSIDHSVVCLRR